MNEVAYKILIYESDDGRIHTEVRLEARLSG